MTHEDYKELLTANALTALDAAEVRALNTHLEGCAECRLEMSALTDSASLLALDAKPLEPSPAVREKILAQLREGEVEYRFDGHAERPGSGLLPFERPQRDVWSSLRSFSAIAASLVFLALIVSLVVVWRQNRANQNEVTRLTTEMKQMQSQLDHDRAMAALLASPDSRMAKLAGTPMAPDAHAMLAYDQSGHAMLMTKGLPAAPKGMAYQLWFIKDDKKMPGKVFKTDAAGNGMLEDEIPSVARNAAVFAITLEPESGVQSPTGSIYLVSAS